MQIELKRATAFAADIWVNTRAWELPTLMSCALIAYEVIATRYPNR